MPCDSITTIGVELGKVDPGLMRLALEALNVGTIQAVGSRLTFGRGEFIDCATGQSQLASYRNAAEVKKAYSAEVVKATAKRYGWQLIQVGQYEYEATKR